MSSSLIRWYRSKVDWWIALLLCMGPVVALSACVALIMEGRLSELWAGIIGLLLVLGVYVGLVFPMRYGVDKQVLHVRFGLVRWQIPLISILRVYPTHNPLSAPALSLNRLHVQYGAGAFDAVLISPAEQDRFLNELAEKAGLLREGNQLLRV